MNLWILFFSSLAVSLFALALVTTQSARLRWRWRGFLPFMFWLLIVGLAGFALFQMRLMQAQSIEPDYAPVMMIWLALFCLFGIICRRGLRYSPGAAFPMAERWSRAKLLLALGLSVGIFGVAMMDLEQRKIGRAHV